MPDSPAIEASSLVRRFAGGVTAVDDVSLAVGPGDVLGLLGPNGAGKTTTIRMLTGYLTPTAGTARLTGIDPQRNPVGARAMLGYLPEGAPLYGEMSPRALLGFVMRARGIARSKHAITKAIERTALEPVADRPIDTLSKGYKRRVGLAQAIVHEPQVLILDEPTDGLDPNQKRAVRALVAELRERSAIIISTHLLEEVDVVCTRVAVMARGRVVFDGSPAGLRALDPARGRVVVRVEQAALDAVRAALASVPDFELERHDHGVLVRVAPGSGANDTERAQLAARVSGALHAFQVTAVEVEPGRLDAVFQQLTDRAHAEERPA